MHHAQTDSCVAQPRGGHSLGFSRLRPAFYSPQVVPSSAVVQGPPLAKAVIPQELRLTPEQCARQCATMVSGRCVRRNAQQRVADKSVSRKRTLRHRACHARSRKAMERRCRQTNSPDEGLWAPRPVVRVPDAMLNPALLYRNTPGTTSVYKPPVRESSASTTEERDEERRGALPLPTEQEHQAIRTSDHLDASHLGPASRQATARMVGYVESCSLSSIAEFLGSKDDSLAAVDLVAAIAASSDCLEVLKYLAARYNNRRKFRGLALVWDRALLKACEHSGVAVCALLCEKLRASPTAMRCAALLFCARRREVAKLRLLLSCVPETRKAELAARDNELLLAAVDSRTAASVALVLADVGVMSALTDGPVRCLVAAVAMSDMTIASLLWTVVESGGYDVTQLPPRIASRIENAGTSEDTGGEREREPHGKRKAQEKAF